jgi:quercetin dioxygenase-like cupin family protein
MGDTTVKKTDTTHSPKKGDEKFLMSGKALSMRMWEDEEPGQDKPEVSRPYETIGYVLKGKAELHLEGQVVTLEAGDSYLVPKDARHTYKILETFTAVEATAPPAEQHGREE